MRAGHAGRGLAIGGILPNTSGNLPPVRNASFILPVEVYLHAMRSLVIAPRFPWPSYTGDRVRAAMWISALARSGEVALIAPRGTLLARIDGIRVYEARRSLRRGVQGALTVLRDRLPLQCLMPAPFDWGAAIAQAR